MKKRKQNHNQFILPIVIILLLIVLIIILRPAFTGKQVYGSDALPTPPSYSSETTSETKPQWNIPSTITISPNYRTSINIINVPPFIRSAAATLTRQNGQKVTLFSTPAAEYHNPSLTLTTLLPATLSNGEKIILDFTLMDLDDQQYTGSSTSLVAQETQPTPTPSASASPSPSPFCRCKSIQLISTEGGDAKPQSDDTDGFGVKPEDLALRYYPASQTLQLGFIIKATCEASDEAALKTLCIEGQELKSTTAIDWDDKTTSFYCKNEQFNPQNPIVRVDNPKARCYDPEVDKNTNPEDDTKVMACLGKNQFSPGFGDDNYHEPHNFPNGKKAKEHKKGKGNEWVVRWIDFSGLIVPTKPKTKNSNVKATGSATDMYSHAYVIGQYCPVTKSCNKCFTISGEIALNDLSSKTLKIEKVPCKFR